MQKPILAVEAIPARCDQCRWFWRKDDSAPDEGGSCRRYPPQMMALDDDVVSIFPSVLPAIACGEFLPVLH